MIEYPMMRTMLFSLLLACGLSACNQGSAPTPATPINLSAAVNTAKVGNAVLQSQTVPLSSINASTARRYGIDTTHEGLLLLITLRDSSGNALAPADLKLSVTGSVLPDPPQPLPLRAIQTAGMTDYIAVLHTKAPASIALKIVATGAGDSTEVATTVELQR